MSILEKTVLLFLERSGILYEQHKRFSFIGKKSLDFYLPDYNVAIECQGIQHYKKDCGMFDGENQQKRDIIKEKECSKNGIKVIYYTDSKNKKIVPKRFKENTFFNLKLLLERIIVLKSIK